MGHRIHRRVYRCEDDMYRDPTFTVIQIKTTMRHMFLDEQSREGSKSGIAGRGFATVTTTLEQETGFGGGEKGHIHRHCPQRRGKGRQKKTKQAGATKWCSVHFSTNHSDEEWYEQGAKRPIKSDSTDKAFSA
ncbi:unnamed protein product [Ectocarpus sp. 12 AP-2014]